MEKTSHPPIAAMLTALLLVTLAPLASWSKTPDGLTPAVEDVCDELHDATPGLYGLCVAYCEAQDCDSIDLAISGQCRAPHPKLLTNYEKKRRAGDPPMPCLPQPEPTRPPSPCRCFGVEDLAALPISACMELDFSTFTALALSDADERNGAMVEHGDGWGVCSLVDDGFARVEEIDEEEAIACEEVLWYHADSKGLDCR